MRVKKEEVLTRQADHRGRVSIGSEYADKEVELVILDSYDGD